MIKISIVIPVYNAEKYLAQCLDSVINQSLKEIEIICVDDGSSDASLQILQSYEKKDGRLKVVVLPHTNAGMARNKGLEIATGEYLYFLDADDYIKSDGLELLYNTAKQYDLDIAIGEAELFNFTTNIIESPDWAKNKFPTNGVFSGKKYRDNLFQLCINWIWNKLYKTVFIKQNGIEFQSITHQNDIVFHQLSLALAKRIKTIDKIIVVHRFCNSNSLEGKRGDNPYLYTEAADMLYEKLKSHKIDKIFFKTFFNCMLFLSFWTISSLDLENKNFKVYERIICEYFAKYHVFTNIFLMNKANFKEFTTNILNYYRTKSHKFKKGSK